MNKKTLALIVFISLFHVFQSSYAQNFYSVLSWNTGFPTGELNDFIGTPSYRGFGFEFGKGINDKVAVGFSVSWNVFYEAVDYGTYTEENLTLSGKQYRYFNAFPIMITSHYFFMPRSKINPYLAGGFGTYSMNQRVEVGLYSSDNNNWHIGLYPEAGLIFNIADDFALNLAARYNYAFKTSNAPSYSYFNLILGFDFLY